MPYSVCSFYICRMAFSGVIATNAEPMTSLTQALISGVPVLSRPHSQMYIQQRFPNIFCKLELETDALHCLMWTSLSDTQSIVCSLQQAQVLYLLACTPAFWLLQKSSTLLELHKIRCMSLVPSISCESRCRGTTWVLAWWSSQSQASISQSPLRTTP